MNPTYMHTDSSDAIANAENRDDTGIIPFADECESKQITASEPAEPQRDSALEAFGEIPKRESVADRELGIDRFIWSREGKYECPCCGYGTSRVMRVRVVHQPGWAGVCAVCAATLLAQLPGTIVGGMVRPTRRRRSKMPGQVAHGFRRPHQSGYRRAG